MTPELDLSGGWRLVGDLSAPEAALAASELEAALGPASGRGIEFDLSHGDGPGDGFRRRMAPDRVELRGESPRDLLFGVYAMLEELGVRWPWPGERLMPPVRRSPIAGEIEQRPALTGRCIVLGERALVEDAEDWIVWAARNRLNDLFIHVSLEPDPVGAAPEAAWLERRERLVALARERGMEIEHGGHLLPDLLSRPDLQALAAGREPSQAAREILAQHVQAHPEAEVLHLWGADLPRRGGGREASEAALRTANMLAAIAEDARPGTQVPFLAYHDTEEVPRGVLPRHNVCLLFAPRERCYEHSLADRECRRNAHYRDLLLAQIEHFRAGGAAEPRVFEYWFDAIRFKQGIPDLSEPMATDLALYRDAGVHTVQMLATGHGGPPSPHPNPAAFARSAWEPSVQ